MTTQPPAPTPLNSDEVHALVDGALSPERRGAAEVLIMNDADLAARVNEYRRQNKALRELFDPWLAEDTPVPLRQAASGEASNRSDRDSKPWAAKLTAKGIAGSMALAGALLIGIGLGWFGRGLTLERAGVPLTFARQAAFAHALYSADANRPVEIWAAEQQRLVNWLTKRMGGAVSAPDLSSSGFSLVGGRLVAGNEKPTALLMYENVDKQRLTLQLRRRDDGGIDTAFRYSLENGVPVFYWLDERYGYALSGNLDRAQLSALAHLIYGQLGVTGPKPP